MEVIPVTVQNEHEIEVLLVTVQNNKKGKFLHLLIKINKGEKLLLTVTNKQYIDTIVNTKYKYNTVVLK